MTNAKSRRSLTVAIALLSSACAESKLPAPAAPTPPMAEAARWARRADLLEANSEMSVAELDGLIYVFGGYPSTRISTTVVQVYDPATDRWETLPALPTQRNHLGMVSVGSKVYVVGGRVGAGFETPTLDKLEVYDVATNAWSTGAPMLKPRGGVNAIVANGYLHVFGGEGNPQATNGVFPDHDVYDPVRNAWIKLPDMPTPVHGVTGAALVNGLIHLPGGGTSSGGTSGSTIHQVYRPATTYP
jgi:N-acetylneuraminic acid mutarotase